MVQSATMDRPFDSAERFFVAADALGGANFLVWREDPSPFDAAPLIAALEADRRLPRGLGRQGFLDHGPASVRREGPWEALVAEALDTRFPAAGPLVRVLVDADRRRVGLCFHHAAADARTGFALLGGGLGADLPWGGLHARLPDEWRDDCRPRALMRAWRKDAIRHGWPMALPGHAPGAAPGPARCGSAALAAEPLRTRARAMGVTVNAVLAASLLRALRRRGVGEDARAILLSSAVDLRPSLTGGRSGGMLVALVPGVWPVAPQDGVADLAERFAAGFAAQRDRGDPFACWRWLDPDTASGGPTGAVLSNVGPVALEGAVAAGLLVTPLPAQPLVATAVTCAGRLDLAVTWREGRLDAATAKAVLADWRAGLAAA